MSDTSKATRDYRVTYACSECAFSTTSGISARAHRDWHEQQDKLYQELENETVRLGIQGAVEALNSYNPERARLARELAEMIGVAQEFRERMQSIPADWSAIETKARQLLKLYEEMGLGS